jgi:hypothetical protein
MAENGSAAMAEVPGATPAPSDPLTSAPAPATGEPPADDVLGEAGKRALEAERTARAAAEREVKKLRDEKLSADERREARIKELEAENAAAEARARSATLRADAFTAASALGFRNPSIAIRLIDQTAVVYGEDGSPKNITALLQVVAKSDPYLVTGSTNDFGGGPRGPAPTGTPDMNAVIRRRARGH